MGIRTGRQYLDKLNAMTPEIYAGGEKITSGVADHPLFRSSAHTYAHLFDMQHAPVYSSDLTYLSPSSGDPVNASFLIPRTESDLARRRKAFSAWTGFSHGFLGRSGDYMNSSLTALASAERFFAKAGPVYGARIRAYYELARENDLLATHTLIPPQANRSVTAGQQAGGQLTARIIEQDQRLSDYFPVGFSYVPQTSNPLADSIRSIGIVEETAAALCDLFEQHQFEDRDKGPQLRHSEHGDFLKGLDVLREAVFVKPVRRRNEIVLS